MKAWYVKLSAPEPSRPNPKRQERDVTTPEEIARSKREEPELWAIAHQFRLLMELAAAHGYTMALLHGDRAVVCKPEQERAA